MIWPPPIEDMRVRIGLDPADNSKDAQIQAALNITLDTVEIYLDRKLLLADDEEEFFNHRGQILVRRWPISRTDPITFFNRDGDDYFQYSNPQFNVDFDKGIVYNIFAHGTSFVRMNYSGGFEELPDALYWAIMSVFDAIWMTTPGWGATGSEEGGVTGTTKKISLVGIGSVELDTGTTSISTGEIGGKGMSSVPWGIIPATVTSVLDRYRRESICGVG